MLHAVMALRTNIVDKQNTTILAVGRMDLMVAEVVMKLCYIENIRCMWLV